jgi:hypothetical protein
MGNKFDYILTCILIFGSLHSCIEKTDFDQFDDLRIEPTVESSILFVEVPERTINLATASTFYSQDFNFDGFSDEFFAERVLDGVVTYVIENTTSKELDVTVEFLDEAGNVLDSEQFTIAAAPPETIDLREIPYGGAGRSLDIIINTSGIRLSAINNGDTTSTSSLPNPKVILKSSGKFRLSLK